MTSNKNNPGYCGLIYIRFIESAMKLTNLKFLWVAILLNSVAVVARGDALDNWTTGQINTNVQYGYGGGFGMASVTYGNGRYVAVGSYPVSDAGLIETSEDGVNWTVRGDASSYSPTVLDLYKVTYGNGTFVAVGYDWYGFNGNLYNSTNGISWTSHTNATVSNFYGVTYGGDLFVAVGDGWMPNSYVTTTNRQIYTSPDGITWTGRSSGPAASPVYTINDIAYGAGTFVAVSYGYIYTSLTGTGWTKRANTSSGSTISYCNNCFILPSGPGTNQISTDGVTWSVLTNNTASTFGRVIYTNGFYVALSGSNIFTSTDVTNWIQRNFPTNVGLRDIALGPRNFIAVGSQTKPGGMPNSTPKAYVSDPFVAVCLYSGLPPQLAISGLQSRSYRIDYLDGFQSGANNWQTLTTFSLTNSPLLWSDITATDSQRFYRAVLLP